MAAAAVSENTSDWWNTDGRLPALLLFGGALVIMSFFLIPEDNREVVVQLVGGVNTLAGLVIGYYFGSSARADDGPTEVTVANTPEKPVPVEEGEVEGGDTH